MTKSGSGVRLGLKENLGQFILLVIVNAFVGGMAGLERAILPELADKTFGIAAHSAILSFIVFFGISKAVTNYYTGVLAESFGRKNLLIAGWIIAIPVPFLLMYAPHWFWIVGANMLLGIHQGLAWSSTVVMKMDLVGEKQRGLAMGLNEFAGYLAIAVMAFVTGWLAGTYGVRPYPFFPGIGLIVLGLWCSVVWVRDTGHHVVKAAEQSRILPKKQLFAAITWKDRNLGSVTQAGLINNLNDGMMWGLFPILLAQKGYDLEQTGLLAALYPAVWGIGQLFTGQLADIYCKKTLLSAGMFLQAAAILLLIPATTTVQLAVLASLLGWGTAMVYPTFLATIADFTHPRDRAKSIGIFRLWRDLGYAAGALLTGWIADQWGIAPSVGVTGGLTFFSGLVIFARMRCHAVENG